jgi:hypothetical protein
MMTNFQLTDTLVADRTRSYGRAASHRRIWLPFRRPAQHPRQARAPLATTSVRTTDLVAERAAA